MEGNSLVGGLQSKNPILQLIDNGINDWHQKNAASDTNVGYNTDQRDTFRCFAALDFFEQLRNGIAELGSPGSFLKLFDEKTAALLSVCPGQIQVSATYNPEIIFEPVLNKKLYNKVLQLLTALEAFLVQALPGQTSTNETARWIKAEKEYIEERLQRIESGLNEVPGILTGIHKTMGNGPTAPHPRVTVITASYNLAAFVEETLRSVSNQDYNSFEHIVIDGASTDGSVDILKKYPGIILVSEKDKGYPDAFWKGLRLAKGEYVLQCTVTDAYASEQWISRCVAALDADKDISLVWGFPAYLTQNSKPGDISFPEFHYREAPQGEAMFLHWLNTSMHYPEGNLCVRREVLLKCYPTAEDCAKKDMIDWLEFSYRFNRLGYVSRHLPVLANYGRLHDDQMGSQLEKDGWLGIAVRNYRAKVSAYKKDLLFGRSTHRFINAKGETLNINFDKTLLVNAAFAKAKQTVFSWIGRTVNPLTYLRFIRRKLKR